MKRLLFFLLLPLTALGQLSITPSGAPLPISGANGGTGVANGASATLTLPNAATTISTGGTIALGGFIFTVPATGTAVTTATLAGGTLPGSFTEVIVSGPNVASGTTQTGRVIMRDPGAGNPNSQLQVEAITPGSNIRLLTTATGHVGINVGGATNSVITFGLDGSGNGEIDIKDSTQSNSCSLINNADGLTVGRATTFTNGLQTLTAGGFVFNVPSGTTNGAIQFQAAGVTKSIFGFAGANNGIIDGSASGDSCFRSQGFNILFSTDSGTTVHWKINSSGTLSSATNNLSVGGTGTFGGAVTIGGIVGTTAGGNATAGNVGEIISASVVQGSATALTTATPKTVTSITLTAGDWDITAIGAITGASTGTVFDVAIGTTTNSLTGTVLGDTRAETPTVSLTGADATLMVPAVRVTISGSTTYYLIVQETFTIGSPAAYGRISARRLR